ncbi:MAG: hypothetical protein J3R72DRAFT_430025 [Linnemannia gamsii]|nr:MAG: hypothetical protein J3R72DRAFT_430025 [Linnemannia gamsii]
MPMRRSTLCFSFLVSQAHNLHHRFHHGQHHPVSSSSFYTLSLLELTASIFFSLLVLCPSIAAIACLRRVRKCDYIHAVLLCMTINAWVIHIRYSSFFFG